MLKNNQGGLLVSDLFKDKILRVPREDSFPAWTIKRQSGIEESHAELRCKHAHKAVKIELKSYPAFVGEVYVFPVRRGPAYVFWSASWIRKFIYPDDLTDNFCGRRKDTWNNCLASVGIDHDGHILHGHHAAGLFR